MTNYISREDAADRIRRLATTLEEQVGCASQLTDTLEDIFLDVATEIISIPAADVIQTDALKQWLATIPFYDISNGSGVCLVCFKDDFVETVKRLNQLRHLHIGVDKGREKSYTAGSCNAQRTLIHCGECRYWVSEDGIHDCLHPGGMVHPRKDSFCSNGLRKDDLNG